MSHLQGSRYIIVKHVLLAHKEDRRNEPVQQKTVRSYIHCPSLSQIGCHSVFLLLDGPQSLCHMAVLFCHCSVPGSSPILLISALNPHTPLPTLNLFILIKGGRKFYILYRIEKLDYSETHTI